MRPRRTSRVRSVLSRYPPNLPGAAYGRRFPLLRLRAAIPRTGRPGRRHLRPPPLRLADPRARAAADLAARAQPERRVDQPRVALARSPLFLRPTSDRRINGRVRRGAPSRLQTSAQNVPATWRPEHGLLVGRTIFRLKIRLILARASSVRPRDTRRRMPGSPPASRDRRGATGHSELPEPRRP